STLTETQKLNNLMAHAILGGVVAELSGGNGTAGAIGAATGELAAPAIALVLYGTSDSKALTTQQKENISALATLASGIAGGVSSDSTAGAATGAQAGKNAVENNALSDIIENKVSGVSQEEKYQNAQKQLVAAVEEFKAQHCAGMSADACSAKISEHRDELLKGAAGFGLDFVPVVGDIKGFAEAQSAIDYLGAMAGLIPVAGDAAGKAIKAAETALKKGDVAEASKLINKASDEIKVKWVDENASMSQRARNYNDSASGARSNIETQKGQAPSIERVDADGKAKSVRFDGVDGNVMVDRKISVVTTQKAKNQALRQSEALKNNGMTGRWEVPNQAQANRAQKMFDELGIKNIEVKIVHE
ncbi:VENN motif pre-toxin domain-containing protein, partial [Lonsdalea quercina]|uniref:VENN motif pre-toxin domain-containing protein n=1 Tax=Lonsdalea quercina TaxID=71657 RepID=UPI0039757DC3